MILTRHDQKDRQMVRELKEGSRVPVWRARGMLRSTRRKLDRKLKKHGWELLDMGDGELLVVETATGEGLGEVTDIPSKIEIDKEKKVVTFTY